MSEKHESNWVNGTDQYANETPDKPTKATSSSNLDRFPPWSTIQDSETSENSSSSPETATQEDRGQLKWNEQRRGKGATSNNPKEGSDWLGGPQNGNESPSTSTEGAYQSTAHSTGYTDQLGSADWLGGPQNGNEIPGNGGNGGNGGNASESLKKP